MYNFKENESLYADIVDNGAPTTGTVGVVGQRYLDKQTSKYYLCVAADSTGPTYTWKEIGANTIIAITDPTTETEGTVGQTYLNTENGHYFVCNKVVEADTWVINDQPTKEEGYEDGSGLYLPATDINFTSNNTAFINIFAAAGEMRYKTESDNTSIVVGTGSFNDSNKMIFTWNNQAYRTVNFVEAPTGDLLAWLNLNAVHSGTTKNYTWLDITSIKYYRHTITVSYMTVTLISEKSDEYTVADLKQYLADNGYIGRKYCPGAYSFYPETLDFIPVGLAVSDITNKILYQWKCIVNYETITIDDTSKQLMKSISNVGATSTIGDGAVITDTVVEL